MFYSTLKSVNISSFTLNNYLDTASSFLLKGASFKGISCINLFYWLPLFLGEQTKPIYLQEFDLVV